MKKHLKLIYLLVAVATLGFTSCNNDESEYKVLIDDFGVLQYIGISGVPYVNLDHGGLAYPIYGLPNDFQGHDGDRVQLAFYAEKQTDTTSIYKWKIDVQRIVKFNPSPILQITSPAQDTLGKDYFYDGNMYHKNIMWIANNYLTIKSIVLFYTGSKHSIYLASYKPDEIINLADTIHLELKHNARNDTKYTDGIVFNSYRLDNLIPLHSSNDSVVLAIKMPLVTDPYETNPTMVTKYVTYKHNKNSFDNATLQSFKMPANTIQLNR